MTVLTRHWRNQTRAVISGSSSRRLVARDARIYIYHVAGKLAVQVKGAV